MIKRIVLVTAATVLGLLMVSCGGSSSNENQPQTTPPATTDATPAAATGQFSFTAYDVNGVLHSSTDWVGKKPVIINFWGTWCPPCRREIPDLVQLYNEYNPKGIEMLGLAVKDQPNQVSAFTKEHGMNWVMMMADNNLVVRYRITGVPTTIFLDRNGNEVRRFIGPQDQETFRKAFELILQS